jgi:hypothetical protein
MTFTHKMIRIEEQQLNMGYKRLDLLFTELRGNRLSRKAASNTRCMKGNGEGYPGRPEVFGDLSGEREVLDKSPPCCAPARMQ